MADVEYTEYVDVQPAPDSEFTVSTGPLVPKDEAHKALGAAAQGDENDSNPQNDKEEAEPSATASLKNEGDDKSDDDKASAKSTSSKSSSK